MSCQRRSCGRNLLPVKKIALLHPLSWVNMKKSWKAGLKNHFADGINFLIN